MAYRQARDNIRTGIGSDSPWIAAPAGTPRGQKSAHPLPKMSAPGVFPIRRGPRWKSHLFGNPAVLPPLRTQWTRGFASPDHSGFALSEFFGFGCSWGQALAAAGASPSENKKRPSSAEDERSWNIPVLPGPRMQDSSLRQPGCPPALKEARARGFASPDRSGFALSEFWLSQPTSCRLLFP